MARGRSMRAFTSHAVLHRSLGNGEARGYDVLLYERE